jgi:hypothetical protein
VQGEADARLAWDVAPVAPPPPAPAVSVRRRSETRRVITEVGIAVVLLSVLAAVFHPAPAQPPLSSEVARMSSDMAALESNGAGSQAQSSEAKLKADVAGALKVRPPSDPVSASAWRYAVLEATAAIGELDRIPPNRPAAETDITSSLQALLLVQSRQHS